MADANRTALRYVKESTAGTTPANPALQEILFRENNLSLSVDTEVDDTIVSDRQVLDVPILGYEVKGDFSCRFRAYALDDFFAASLSTTWNKRTNTTYTGIVGSTGVVTVAAGTGTNFIVGQLVKFTGSPLNTGQVHRVTAVAANNVTFGATGLVDESAVSGTLTVVGIEGASADIVALATPARLQTTALDWLNLGVTVGQWIKVSEVTANSFATAANNTWVRVSAVTATIISLDSVPTGWAADVGTGKTIRLLMGDYIRNGTTRTPLSFEAEVKRDDNISMYRMYSGVELGTSFNMKARSNVEVKFDAMGMAGTNYNTSRFSGATTLAPVAGDIFSSSSNLGKIRINNTDFMTAITNLSIEIGNNYRGREAVGSPSYASLGAGTLEVKGAIEAYFGDAALVNAVQNNTALALSVPVLASDKSSGYLIDIPRLKFVDGGDDNKGLNTDVTASVNYQGLKHPTLGYTIQMSRYNYLE